MKIVGIDIGGTTIKADIYDEKGHSFDQFQEVITKIDHHLQSNQILDQVCDIIERYIQNHQIDGVGLSSAGVVDVEKGEIVYAGYTIPGYIGTNFIKTISEKFGLSATIDNDVNCAALGEMWLGRDEDISNMVMLTIGTGIGGSIIINHHIVRGFNFTAGEVGYLPVGNHDWQNKASTTALLNLYREKTLVSQHNGKTFFEALRSGDQIAAASLNIFIDNLTEGLLSIVYLLNPEMIVIGGGILENEDILIPRIEQNLYKKVVNSRFLPKYIVAAKLGNEAGRLGAVKNFLNQYSL